MCHIYIYIYIYILFLLQTPTVFETVAVFDLISANGHLIGSEVISDRMYISVGLSMCLPIPVTGQRLLSLNEVSEGDNNESDRNN